MAIKDALVQVLGERLAKAGLDATALTGDFDLVQSGLLDSFEFLNLIGELEAALGCEIDLGCADESFTTVAGLSALAGKGAAGQSCQQ